jgi:hypothetical protein
MTTMSELNARPIDPRHTSWEVWDPVYRVDFWRPTGGAWASREFEVDAPDVVEALRWAADHAADAETFTLFAVVANREGRGLVHLAGDDPTRAQSPPRGDDDNDGHAERRAE